MKSSAAGIVTAFLAGAAVGALLGIMFAPDKGSATRTRLRNKAEGLKEEILDGFENLREEFMEDIAEPVKAKTARKPRAKKPKPPAGKKGE
jgi:gas vesicle protein